MSLGTQKEILLAIGGLPGDYSRAMKQNLDSFARRQTRSDARVILRNRDLRGSCDGRDGNGAGFLRTLHLDWDPMTFDFEDGGGICYGAGAGGSCHVVCDMKKVVNLEDKWGRGVRKETVV